MAKPKTKSTAKPTKRCTCDPNDLLFDECQCGQTQLSTLDGGYDWVNGYNSQLDMQATDKIGLAPAGESAGLNDSARIPHPDDDLFHFGNLSEEDLLYMDTLRSMTMHFDNNTRPEDAQNTGVNSKTPTQQDNQNTESSDLSLFDDIEASVQELERTSPSGNALNTPDAVPLDFTQECADYNKVMNNTFSSVDNLDTSPVGTLSSTDGPMQPNGSINQDSIPLLFDVSDFNSEDFADCTFDPDRHPLDIGYSIGNGPDDNTFVNGADGNSSGNGNNLNGLNVNTFGNGPDANNAFVNGADMSTLGNGLNVNGPNGLNANNTFVNGADGNTFGNGLNANNTFVNAADVNSSGNENNANTFGNGCNANNTFSSAGSPQMPMSAQYGARSSKTNHASVGRSQNQANFSGHSNRKVQPLAPPRASATLPPAQPQMLTSAGKKKQQQAQGDAFERDRAMARANVHAARANVRTSQETAQKLFGGKQQTQQSAQRSATPTTSFSSGTPAMQMVPANQLGNQPFQQRQFSSPTERSPSTQRLSANQLGKQPMVQQSFNSPTERSPSTQRLSANQLGKQPMVQQSFNSPAERTPLSANQLSKQPVAQPSSSPPAKSTPSKKRAHPTDIQIPSSAPKRVCPNAPVRPPFADEVESNEERGRMVSELLKTKWLEMTVVEKARLLLPMISGKHPLQLEKEELYLGTSYGAARQREALNKALELNQVAVAEAQAAVDKRALEPAEELTEEDEETLLRARLAEIEEIKKARIAEEKLQITRDKRAAEMRRKREETKVAKAQAKLDAAEAEAEEKRMQDAAEAEEKKKQEEEANAAMEKQRKDAEQQLLFQQQYNSWNLFTAQDY